MTFSSYCEEGVPFLPQEKAPPSGELALESLTGEDLNGDGVVAPDVTRTDAEASAVELDEVDESATVEQENEK